MTSKGPRSKLDHETRAKRQKALEASREPCRPKTHWDHVLEEMVWLSKDFECERKFKLALAKKVALKASKGMLDQATRGERRVKEEELRLRKVALNISKDMKKFWLKIEKLVLYKHQLEVEGKKKKALDKQLEFLLGQTERYSTMLAENLVDAPTQQFLQSNFEQGKGRTRCEEVDIKYTNDCTGLNGEPMSYPVDSADNIDNIGSEDDYEDDLDNIDEDESFRSKEDREEELAALRSDENLPVADLLKCHAVEKGRPNDLYIVQKVDTNITVGVSDRRCPRTDGQDSGLINRLLDVKARQHQHAQYDFTDDQEDGDFDLAVGEDKDDEATLSVEEKLEKEESNECVDEISILQKESEIPVEELLATYTRDCNADNDSNSASLYSEEVSESSSHDNIELDPQSKFMDVDDEPREPQFAGKQDGHDMKPKQEEKESEVRIADAAEAARSAQPTGNTFSTTNVRTKFPFLLKHPLREYQHIGLDWLVTMYEKRLNGILADEMGLGKTIMTIALLAHLACEKGIWAPHLIVVPTSVLLNWETEFLKWCPALKILTYFGSAKERKHKRQGWLKPNSFHVCITTYRLVIQDAKAFKRKKWKYLILDEAHLIKNWKSQRWQTLLNFNSKRRILLTGTPLQNDLMELWSLMHFLMPHIFQSHQEFKDWFVNPISGMVEGQEKINKEVVDRLHNVLRPFILRRLKRDVEKQLPLKYEHVVFCRLSRRQRNLYEDFIANSDTQATLASANFFGMISVIMQLRKVCNHPDLFEGRPIISSFDMGGIDLPLCSSICSMLSLGPFSSVDLSGLGFLFTHLDFKMTSWEFDEVQAIATPSSLIKDRFSGENPKDVGLIFRPHIHNKNFHDKSIFLEIRNAVFEQRLKQAKERAASIAWWNSLRCRKKPMYSTTLRELVTVKHGVYDIHDQKVDPSSHMNTSTNLSNMVLSPVERFSRMIEQVECFLFAIPAARAPSPVCWCKKIESLGKNYDILLPLLSPIRPAIVRRQVYFPDRRLIQFDCGKLQELAVLLRRLKSEGHRVLIFTQMTKMLDILEAFINLYGYTYMRLDGSTLPEARQTLMQRFNTNPKFFIFILSTRSGGVGINLVGADTVIFYDSDWNPAMDQQAQDRCHRIGQTREVHIYRLISDSTIEENILKKANQKRALDDLVIQSGGYNTDFFKKLDPMELLSGHKSLQIKHVLNDKNNNNGMETALSNADVEAALKNVEDEADYMALKKIEEEEAVENQEFTEEVIGKMEDDELVNEDEWKGDEPADPVSLNKDSVLVLPGTGQWEEGDLALTNKEDDIDMLADVRQMTEVATETGQEVISFDDQLRPIDRYAMRFLELWDPIVDKAAMESEVRFEETEWELDRIEKLKEDMEAEIDDDEEPFVYESWDADFATEAYRQQVEALTQNQLIEELENEARERDAGVENFDSMKNHSLADSKPRPRKKPKKKKKFKSLKKGTLDFDSRTMQQHDFMSSDDEPICDSDIAISDLASHQLITQKKRKKVGTPPPGTGESIVTKKLKKTALESIVTKKFKDSELSETPDVYLEPKSGSKSRFGAKIYIPTVPVKRILMIKPEKSKKKGSMWSKGCFPSPDKWLPQEDAILCAVVHEYGAHWCLVSETLYGMSGGGVFRGRYRHPIHCCERFRELVHRYVLSTAYQFIHEKVSNAGSVKGLLKVTEDNLRTLLDLISRIRDDEFLLQRHFTALLSSIWRMKSRSNSLKHGLSSQNGFTEKRPPDKMNFIHLAQCRNLLSDALNNVGMKQQDPIPPYSEMQEPRGTTEHIEITLEFQTPQFDPIAYVPSHINVVIYGSDAQHFGSKLVDENFLLRSPGGTAEIRFREGGGGCVESSNLGLASSPLSVKSRPGLAKPSKSKLKKCLMEVGAPTDANLKVYESAPDWSGSCDMEPGFEDLLGVPDEDDDDCYGSVPHEYTPGFISDLDHCSLAAEFTEFE